MFRRFISYPEIVKEITKNIQCLNGLYFSFNDIMSACVTFKRTENVFWVEKNVSGWCQFDRYLVVIGCSLYGNMH